MPKIKSSARIIANLRMALLKAKYTLRRMDNAEPEDWEWINKVLADNPFPESLLPKELRHG